MRLRPAPTTTIATALLLIVATLPLREVFGDWSWTISVAGAAIASSVLASAIETGRPGLPVPLLYLTTSLSAVIWALFVSLRNVFWQNPTAGDAWRDLGYSVRHGWGELLDERLPLTDPQSAETFISVVVWIAAAIAVHTASRRRTALVSIAAAAAVLAITSAASLPSGLPPTALGGAAGVFALVAIATLTRAPDQRWVMGRQVALISLIAAAAGLATIGGLLSRSLDRTPADPRSAREVETLEFEVPDILAEFGVRRDEARTVLTIEGSAPPDGVRLRLQVYDRHNGERWLPATGFEELSVFSEAGELPPGDVVSATIRIDQLDGPWIPSTDRLIAIDVPDIRWSEETQTIIAATPPTRYEITGTIVSRDNLEGLDSARDEVPDRLREIPAGLPVNIREVATAATPEATDAIGAIDAISARLRMLDRDESRSPGNSFGRLRDDLASGEPTGAEQIASLHALMLRSVGIPSRLVVGYVADGSVVESDDLHIWVEAAFPSVGWVAFDPVPEFIESGGNPTDDPAVPTTTTPSDAAVEAQALPRELGPGEDPDEPEIGSENPFARPSAAVLAIILLIGAAVTLFGSRLVRRRIRASAAGRADVRVLGAWAELVDRMRELGAPITGATTTGDIVYMANVMDETLGEHTATLAELAAIALHSPVGCNPDQADAAWDALQLAEAQITAVRGRAVVPRRYLDPRVLRYRAPTPPPTRDGRPRATLR